LTLLKSEKLPFTQKTLQPMEKLKNKFYWLFSYLKILRNKIFNDYLYIGFACS